MRLDRDIQGRSWLIKNEQFRLESKGVAFGRLGVEPDGSVDLSQVEGVDADLVIRPFSQKGVIDDMDRLGDILFERQS